MSRPYVSWAEIQDVPLWDKAKSRRTPVSFDLEITARCNNNCRHCYINLPRNSASALAAELSREDINQIASEAVDMGAVWCLITGGEPLLRADFAEIYLDLKRLGLLVSVFTNACLVTADLAELFHEYPPRDVEVTVYGATAPTYELVTRRSGSYDAFTRGLELLASHGVGVRLKGMALRSNAHELEAISRFCRARTKDYYRWDPLLHLRLDADARRNQEIKAERLTPQEVVAVERADNERFGSLQSGCSSGNLIDPTMEHVVSDYLFQCGAGNGSFTVGYDGSFRLCSSLCHSDTVYDLRCGTVREAWEEWVPSVRAMRSNRPDFLNRCRHCSIINLCMWCPAHAALETGAMDEWVEYFCEVAHARAAAATGMDNDCERPLGRSEA